MRKHFARRPLRRRVIALAAAYAVVLSNLIASFAGARAAAEAAIAPGDVICHTAAADPAAPAPASDQTNNKQCVENCCVGCLMLMAALPPPAKLSGETLSAPQPIAPPAPIVLRGGAQSKDHRSRAPPLAA